MITSVGKGVGQQECLYIGGEEFNLAEPLWKTVWLYLLRLKIHLPYDPASPRIYFRTANTYVLRVVHKNIYSSIIRHNPKLETTQMSIICRMDKKLWYFHTMEYHLELEWSNDS